MFSFFLSFGQTQNGNEFHDDHRGSAARETSGLLDCVAFHYFTPLSLQLKEVTRNEFHDDRHIMHTKTCAVFRACAKRVSTPAGSRPVEREGKLGPS